MKHLEKYTLSRVVATDREQLFQVVSGIERYPEFVPGYREARVRKRVGDRLVVKQTVNVLGWNVSFDSLATLDPPRAVVIEASPPGFKTFRVEWRLEGLASGGTRIEITIHYEASNFLARRFSRPWVQAFAGMQVKAFLARIRTLGRRP